MHLLAHSAGQQCGRGEEGDLVDLGGGFGGIGDQWEQ
jgi:hypothetical protein